MYRRIIALLFFIILFCSSILQAKSFILCNDNLSVVNGKNLHIKIALDGEDGQVLFDGEPPIQPIYFEAKEDDNIVIDVTHIKGIVIDGNNIVNSEQSYLDNIILYDYDENYVIIPDININGTGFYNTVYHLEMKIKERKNTSVWHIKANNNDLPFIDDTVYANQDTPDFKMSYTSSDGLGEKKDISLVLLKNSYLTFVVGNLFNNGSSDDLYLVNQNSTQKILLLSKWETSNSTTGVVYDNPEIKQSTIYISDSYTQDVGIKEGSNSLIFNFNIDTPLNFYWYADGYYYDFGNSSWYNSVHSNSRATISSNGNFQLYYHDKDADNSFSHIFKIGKHKTEIIDLDDPTEEYSIEFVVNDDNDTDITENGVDADLSHIKDIVDYYNYNPQIQTYTPQSLLKYMEMGDNISKIELPVVSDNPDVIEKYCRLRKLQLSKDLYFDGFFNIMYFDKNIISVTGGVGLVCYEVVQETSDNSTTTTTHLLNTPTDTTIDITIETTDGDIKLSLGNKYVSADNLGTIFWTNHHIYIPDEKQFIGYKGKIVINTDEGIIAKDFNANINKTISPAKCIFSGSNNDSPAKPFTISYFESESGFSGMKLDFDLVGECENDDDNKDFRLFLVLNRTDKDYGETGDIEIELSRYFGVYWSLTTNLEELLSISQSNNSSSSDTTQSDIPTASEESADSLSDYFGQKVSFYIKAIDKNGIVYPGKALNRVYTIYLPKLNFPLAVISNLHDSYQIGDDYNDYMDIYIGNNLQYKWGFNVKFKMTKFVDDMKWLYLSNKYGSDLWFANTDKNTFIDKFLTESKTYNFNIKLPKDWYSFMYKGKYLLDVEIYDAGTNDLLIELPTIFEVN